MTDEDGIMNFDPPEPQVVKEPKDIHYYTKALIVATIGIGVGWMVDKLYDGARERMGKDDDANDYDTFTPDQ